MGNIRVGLIGCGSFALKMHIPNLKKNKKYEIHAVMDIDEMNAKQAAEVAGAAYWTTDAGRIIKDKEIDAIFITTRHDSHAKLAVMAADAGKHVFCEKPMALDADGCRDIAAAVKRSNVKYTVGYNRGLAPMITKASSLLKSMEGKKMLYHRIQAPFPEDSWTHDPKVGGGRFVGEGCHIFDLFCELVRKPPVSVYASGGTFLNPGIVKIPDSAIVTITFADGSVAATLINSAGCPDFPKESTEVYCDNKAIYISDFKRMEYYGFEGHDRISIEFDCIDKGQAIEIDMFADAVLSGAESPNGIIKAARAAAISYKVNESIAKGIPISVCEKDYVF